MEVIVIDGQVIDNSLLLNALTKLLTFHSSVLSFERSAMSDRLISNQDAYIAKKKSSAV